MRLLDSLNVGSSPEGHWPGPKSQEVSGDGWWRARGRVCGLGSESEKTPDVTLQLRAFDASKPPYVPSQTKGGGGTAAFSV